MRRLAIIVAVVVVALASSIYHTPRPSPAKRSFYACPLCDAVGEQIELATPETFFCEDHMCAGGHERTYLNAYRCPVDGVVWIPVPPEKE